MKKILRKGSQDVFFTLMKYTTIVCIIMTMFCSVVYADRTLAQTMSTVRVNLDVSRVTAEEVLDMIEQRTGFRFIYNKKDISVQHKVSMHVTDVTVAEALRQLFHNKPTRFKQQGSSIVLLPRLVTRPVVQGYGGIQGTVTDAASGLLLPGASIFIAETSQGAATDVEGKFAIAKVPVGTYSVTVSFVGYQSRTIQNVTVTANNVSNIEVPIAQAASSLGEIVVKGDVDVRYTAIENSTEEALISDIRDASTIVTGISNIQIVRSLDRDASDVMRRVPGVTVLNNFVLVRGMDPRYNVTYLNNMLIPSTESDSRAFGFNLIPSGLIDDIKIYKAPAPELPGGFGGGVVKVSTKKSQATRHIQVDVSGQFRTSGSSFSDYYTGSNATGKDTWGLRLKGREMPSIFTTNPVKLPDQNFYPGEYMAAIRSLPEVNNLKKDKHTLDRRASINYYDSYKIGSVRLNNLTAVSYTYQRTNQFRTRASQGLKEWRADSEGHPQYFIPNDQSLDTMSFENVRISVLENLGLKINDNHKIAFNLFANRNAEDNTLLSAEIHTAGNPSLGKPYPLTEESFNSVQGATKWRNVGFEYRVRDLISGQLSGNHILNPRLTLDWNVGQTSQTDYTPDWQTFLFNGSAATDRYDWQLTTNATDNNTRMRYRTEEKVELAGADINWTVLPILTVKTGTLLQRAHRQFDNNNYNVTLPPGNNVVQEYYANLYQPWYSIQRSYADENFREDKQGFNMTVTSSALSYQFDQNIVAVYLASRLYMLNKKLELYGGMRYENEYAQLYDNQGRPVADIPGPNFENYLPSAHLTWSITDRHKLRTSYGKSIDRPAYRERSSAGYYSVRDAVNYVGNPELKNASLDNYDLRWEWYPNDNEFIAVGAYYKYIDNPIEMYEYGSSGFARLYRTWLNKRWAKVSGLEVEVRKNLGFIPLNIMKQFSVIINGSYMITKVREDVTLNEGQTVDVRLERPLTGSSPYAFNANLYYEHPKLRTQVTVAYNYIGERIIVTAPSFIGNLHEKAQHQLDLVLIQPIGKHLRLKAGVQNLLNLPIIRWRDGNLDGDYHPGIAKPAEQLIDPGLAENRDHEAERWKTGAYYSLGITVTF